MKAWKRSAFPLQAQVPLEPVESEVLIANIVRWMEMGREIAAASGLVVLRLRFEALDPATLLENERTWDEFVRRRIPVPAEQVNELLGRMVHRGGLLRCTKCGTVTGCSCHCGVAYVGEHPWATPVTEKVTEKPRRGRPSSGSALTAAERKRKQRNRQRNPSAPPPERDH